MEADEVLRPMSPPRPGLVEEGGCTPWLWGLQLPWGGPGPLTVEIGDGAEEGCEPPSVEEL